MKVMFVCTGNTCRSPMAEVLCREAAKELGVKDMTVQSAGISAEIGAPASENARRVMAEYGLSLENHTAHQLSGSYLADADEVLTMTAAQRDLICRLMPQYAEKVRTLKPEADISDPYGGDIFAYRRCAEELIAAVQAYFDALSEKKKAKRKKNDENTENN